jgi:hypothetical protein
MINLNFILYTAFRLAPFILVSFFSLSSLLNQDLKGIIYLAGLLLACFLAVLAGNSIPDNKNVIDEKNTLICNVLTLSDTGRLSQKVPLSMTVFCYTFFYLVYIIGKYKLANQNVPTIIVFSLLIIGEYVWNLNYGCSGNYGLLTAFAVGSLVGTAWSAIIDSTKMTDLQYFNGISNAAVCSRPSKQIFKCKKTTA